MMVLAFVVAATLGASPTPSPTPAPAPQYSLDGAISGYFAHSSPDGTSIADVGNGILTLAKNGGALRFSVTAGAYAFPTLGAALVPTTQQGANASLYGYVPAYAVSYVANAHVTV
ncbi:MAG TPA: hypothetical protein VNF68_05465, partial [Candidatus Baltobacteraceae bacterium]|nr:hypothetical protein [Candidatus Baltobacteraceae bacterium]